MRFCSFDSDRDDNRVSCHSPNTTNELNAQCPAKSSHSEGGTATTEQIYLLAVTACVYMHGRSTQHRTLPRPQIFSTYLCPHAPWSLWMLGNAVFVFRLRAPREYNTHLGVVKWNLWVMILQHWMRECKAIPRSRRYLAWWSQCHTQQLHWYRLEQLADAWPA